ncbi:MAG: hypothetical protein MUP49_05570 [Dehalococcoidia bacterium]|nr:hypothetical protein [Dehalococcoidia bacterium]
MKERIQAGIAALFSVALVVFFGMGRIPLDVFAPIIAASLVWLFRDIQEARIEEIRRKTK